MQKDAGHGGARAGAGRKPKYGGKTMVMRVPVERADDVERFLLCGDGQLAAVVEVLKRWREKIGSGERCKQPRWKHACELLEEIERMVKGNLKK